MAQNSNQSQPTIPSLNFSNLQSPEGIIGEVLAEFSRNLEVCMPAIVVSYDRVKHEAIVQPAINVIMTTGEQVTRAQMFCTVWRFCAGGYLIDLPLEAGDTGWLIASDRNTTNFKENPANPTNPNTYETHKYSAGFFIPDKFGSLTLTGEDGRMVIMNGAGTEKISIGESDTHITSAALTITCPNVVISGNATIGGKSFLGHTHTTTTTGNPTSAPN